MILIVSQSKKLSRSVAETFHFMSILSYGATPPEALSEISEIYKAVLILNPESFPDIKDYIFRLKSYKSDIPIFALAEDSLDSKHIGLFDGVFTKSDMTPALAKEIIAFANEHHLAKIGDYKIGGFDASCNRNGVKYFSDDIKLTKTEAMILRFLAVTYPIPQKAESIIKYAFKSSRAPEQSSIRTHISIMNKKYEKLTDRRMIVFIANQGYIVLTPEIMYKEKVNK